MALTFSLMEYQEPFVFDDKHRFVGFVGGYGCGKSKSFCYRGILAAKRNPGRLGALLEPVVSMVETDLVPTWEQTLDDAGVKWECVSKSYHIYHLHFPGQTFSRVQLMSAENHNRLRGKNLAWWGVDEFDTIRPLALQKLVLEQLLARLRSGHSEQSETGFFVSTPEGFGGMYEFFVTDVERDKKLAAENGEEYVADRVLYRASTRQNYLLKPNYIKTLQKQYPPQLLAAYLEGEFVNLARGTVYVNYGQANDCDLTIEKYFEQHGHLPPLHAGFDFNNGKNGGGSCVVYIIKDNCAYAVDEVMGTRRTAETCDILRKRYPNHTIYAHPDKSGGQETSNSEKTNFNYLYDAGFEVFEQDSFGNRSNPDIVDRVNSVNALLKNGDGEVRMFVNKDKCPIFAGALARQSYAENGYPMKDGKVDGPLDAGGYVIWNVFPTSRRGAFRTGRVAG